MKLFLSLTALLMLLKHLSACGTICGPSPLCPPPVICPPRICPPCLPISPPIRPVSICCQTCVCSLRRKRSYQLLSANDNNILPLNPVCNNDQLMMIMKKKISANETESAFAIKKAADSKFGTEFNVFCAINDITHVAHVENFCQYKKGHVICFAYES